jgi:MFS family permease
MNDTCYADERITKERNKFFSLNYTKPQKDENKIISTLLLYITIPLSGFAVDVYLPSFPNMVNELHTSVTSLQATLAVYLLSYGISQFLVGAIVDSFGRYKIGITAFFLFAISCFIVAATRNINLIIFLRAIQGLLIATLMICQRSFLVDLYKDEPQKLKKYTSLISIIWSTAPIIAPFVGGYIQYYFNWQSNFYFLGIYALVMMIMHLIFSGEALKHLKPFQWKSISVMYKEMFVTKDFVYGVLLLGTSFSMVILFGMSIPFIAENKYHFTSKTTGNLALLSGVSLFLGGLFNRYMINRSITKKLTVSIIVQFVVAVVMLIAGIKTESLITIMLFVVMLHFLEGFIYNMYFTYCLTRFTSFAGLSSGFTSGGAYIITSFITFMLSHQLIIKGQLSMAVYYVIIIALMLVILMLALPHLRIVHKPKVRQLIPLK